MGLGAPILLILLSLQSGYSFNWADEGLMWYVSQRTALGQIPIRDFFSYDPGRYYWSAFFFKLLYGNGLWQQILADVAFGSVGLTIAYFASAKTGVSRPLRLMLLAALSVMLGFPRHKIYEQTLSLMCVVGIAFVLAKPDAPKRWLAYGVITGLAGFVGRNSGVYFAAAGLLLFICLKILRMQVSVARSVLFGGLGLVVGFTPMISMLCFIHGLPRAVYDSLLFTPRMHDQLRVPIPFPWHVHLRGLEGFDALHVRAVSILCLLVPATYFFSVRKWMKEKGDPLLRLACASAIAGIPFLHHAFDRADFFHIAQGIVPFAISAVSLAAYYWEAELRKAGAVIMTSAFVLILAAWLPYEPLVQFLRAKPGTLEQVEISGKQFYVEAEQAKVMRATRGAFQTCGSEDGSFLQAPYYPGLYPYLQTRAPFWELFYLYPRDESFQKRHIEALEQNRVSLVLLNRDAAIDGRDGLRIERTYPELVSYILAHYRRSATKLPDGFELYYLPAWCPNMR